MSTALYQAVTDQIVQALSRGVVPWRKPWHGTAALPANAVSKRPYRGVNVLLLGLNSFRDHRWLSFRQAKELGGNVKLGERSSLAIFWKRWEVERTDPRTGQARRDRIPLLRSYRVFNVEQCEGLRLEPLPIPETLEEKLRIKEAELLVRSMPNPPTIEEGGTSAWYRPSDDRVQIPPIWAFTSADAYYGTLLHELGHATGHPIRLNRPEVLAQVQFGSSDYGREELVAELASAFCCASLGLDNSLTENSASYIDSWLHVLRYDSKLVVIAAAQAQRAADFIRGVMPELA